ncbi:Vacuolar protein sorting-associated protein 41, partial [Quaeritorhiza haematococci]
MLENLGSFIDPIRLVRRIPNGLEIPGLRDALIKIMSDNGIQMSLREGCEKILISDTVELLEQLYKAQKRGLEFSAEFSTCSVCEGLLAHDGKHTPRILRHPQSSKSKTSKILDHIFPFDTAVTPALEDASLVMFFCRHTFHSSCLTAAVDAKAKGTIA